MPESNKRIKKLLLAAINAKYIHSNPAVYSLRAYAGERLLPYIEIAEYTINYGKEEILADLYGRKPDLIAFSCYIWNWEMIETLLRELPKVLPECVIWLGGPEVSYEAEKILRKFPMVKGIMLGEGEETFKELAEYYCGMTKPVNCGKAELSKSDGVSTGKGAGSEEDALSVIGGILYRKSVSLEIMSNATIDGIMRTEFRKPADISKLPFLYPSLQPFTNRILYYESSRGCPYRCSYCLSSIDKKVRLRNPDTVKKELQFFLDHRVKQVKFIDRTFNSNHEHAKKIWKYLAEHDNGVTNFHFEIAADLITEEELFILAKMRPGFIQLEIGVQTLNQEVLAEIRRKADNDRLKNVVAKIKEGGNIHIHLDLIAGLPLESYESFRCSFNGVYAMQPHQLQLGFLKVLKGTLMKENAKKYELQYTETPPYEVLSTKWLSYDQILLLKKVEQMVELYYNSNQFLHTMPLLQSVFTDAFSMYAGLSDYYKEQNYFLMTPSRLDRYQALLSFGLTTDLRKYEDLLRQVLTFDFYLRENSKRRPEFASDLSCYKMRIRNFYETEEKEPVYLVRYKGYDSRQMSKMTHMEVFTYPVWEEDMDKRRIPLAEPVMVLFDYAKRDPLTYAATYYVLERNQGK